ncbi:MAG: FHA domain-containing protein [Anaerolineales bacterium]
MSEKINKPTPVLVAQGGSLNGYRWSLHDQLVIGRTDSCDVIIPNRQVSRRHSRLMSSDQGVFLEDLNSKNGTFVNGDIVQEKVPIKDGDVIQIALAQEFIYLSKDATIPLDISDFRPSAFSSPKKLKLDLESHRIWIDDQELSPPLSALQFKLLAYLYKKEGNVVSRQEIIHNVWGKQEAAGVSDQALDALIRRLRERLSELDPDHEYIVTIRSQGFRLDIPSLP